MDLGCVVLLEAARQELAGLPPLVRQNVEAFLANLDVSLATVPFEQLATIFQKDDTGSFSVRAGGAAVFFSLVPSRGRAIIHRVEPES